MQRRRKQDASDREILRRVASGDPRALAEAYDRHAARLFRQILWLTGHREDAEDVVQAVFVKLAGMGGDLLGIRRPGAFLATVARREALDRMRRRRHETNEPGEWFETPGPSPDDAAEAARVTRAMAGLSPTQREVILLRVYEGLTFREIAHATGVGTFTAASRFRLAIRRLRRDLGLPDGGS